MQIQHLFNSITWILSPRLKHTKQHGRVSPLWLKWPSKKGNSLQHHLAGVDVNVRESWSAEMLWRCGWCFENRAWSFIMLEKGGQEECGCPNMRLHSMMRYLSVLKGYPLSPGPLIK